MSQQSKHLYEFRPYRLDPKERLLQRDGVTISLTPKAFDLLLALVERHGRLVEKAEGECQFRLISTPDAASSRPEANNILT